MNDVTPGRFHGPSLTGIEKAIDDVGQQLEEIGQTIEEALTGAAADGLTDEKLWLRFACAAVAGDRRVVVALEDVDRVVAGATLVADGMLRRFHERFVLVKPAQAGGAL